MGKWKHRIDIRSIVLKYEESEDADVIIKCGREVARAIREAKLPHRFFTDIQDLVVDWENGNCDTPDEMNYALCELYDWGDVVRVWLGDVHDKRPPCSECGRLRCNCAVDTEGDPRPIPAEGSGE